MNHIKAILDEILRYSNFEILLDPKNRDIIFCCWNHGKFGVASHQIILAYDQRKDFCKLIGLDGNCKDLVDKLYKGLDGFKHL